MIPQTFFLPDTLRDVERSYLEEYLKLIRKDLKMMCDECEKKKKEIEDEGFDSHDDIMQAETYMDGLWDDACEMKQLMYRSFLVSIFMFMEAQFIDLCRHVHYHKRTVFEVTDLGGQGITRVKKFLKKILSRDFPLNPVLNNELDILRILRNSFIHNDGRINKNDKSKTEKYKRDNPDDIDICDSNRVVLKDGYMDKLIDINKEICREIADVWKEVVLEKQQELGVS